MTVDVAADGSGTVTVGVLLDREAAERVGDPSKAIVVDDLRDAGWSVAAPETTEEGTTLSASKRFGSPRGLQEVMSELGHELFEGWKIRIDDGFGSTTTKVSGRIHLTGSLDQFGDADLTKALDGQPLGRSAEQLAADGGGKSPTFPVTLTVRLPDDVSGDGSKGGRTEGRLRTWTFDVGDAKAVDRELVASAEHGGTLPLLVVIAGVAVLIGAAVLVVTPSKGARSRRRR